MLRQLALVTASVMILVASAGAIVIRHDRPDTQYKRLGTDFPMVCRVGNGMGILVDSLWVLTSAQVGMALRKDSPTVAFGRRVMQVSHVVVHPEYSPKGQQHDLALIRLKYSVTLFYAAGLNSRTDEWGELATLGGDGDAGNGETGPASGKRVMRAARNRVDSAWAGWMRFTFNKPPEGDSLEGIGGPGDEGGPALFEKGDSLIIIGVYSHNPKGLSRKYGGRAYYTPIADELDWLRQQISTSQAPPSKP